MDYSEIIKDDRLKLIKLRKDLSDLRKGTLTTKSGTDFLGFGSAYEIWYRYASEIADPSTVSIDTVLINLIDQIDDLETSIIVDELWLEHAA